VRFEKKHELWVNAFISSQLKAENALKEYRNKIQTLTQTSHDQL